MGKEIDLDETPALKASLQAALDEADIHAEAVALFPENMLLVKSACGCFDEWHVERGEDEKFHVVGL